MAGGAWVRVRAVVTAAVFASACTSPDPGDPQAFCEAWHGGDTDQRIILRTAPAAIDEAVGLYVARSNRGDPLDEPERVIAEWVSEHCA